MSIYHAQVLPSGGAERRSESIREMAATFREVVVSFLKKPNIYLLLLFIVLYRAGEGQVVKIGPLFLVDKRAVGGLGLTTDQFGTIYGTFGTMAFIVGSVLGGYFTSWLGLRRALLPLVCAMNLPNLAYVYLSTALPASHLLITAALSVEMFGYGFGFVGVILLMMQEIAPGKVPDGPLRFRQFADESWPDGPGRGQRQNPDGDRLSEFLPVGADVLNSVSDSGATRFRSGAEEASRSPSRSL